MNMENKPLQNRSSCAEMSIPLHEDYHDDIHRKVYSATEKSQPHDTTEIRWEYLSTNPVLLHKKTKLYSGRFSPRTYFSILKAIQCKKVKNQVSCY